MPASRRGIPPNHPIVITFLIFAAIGFMSMAAEFLKPLALAVLLSFALAPLASFLEKRGLPRAAAVVLTILLALGVLGGVGYKVGQQLNLLANDLPKYEEHIKKKLTWLKPDQETSLDRLSQMGRDVAKTLDAPPKPAPGVQQVSIVSVPTFTQRLESTVGPYIESLGVVSFVLILVLFMLSNREDLTDRIVRLFGKARVSLTTKTMEEVGQRISRYLAVFSMVNSCFGLIIGLGLWAIGLPYAVLWGVLFALLRFIPYVGPAAAFALPLVFSFAFFEGWRQPLMVVALFAALETAANSFLEPIIYGKTTGVSALGLLVAAMFWTWLWGALGLLLSTPLTVCLAVLGKYVPALGVFGTLLGEEPALEPDVRFYQRLLAMDQDGALGIVEEALKKQPRAEVFDEILIPTLVRVERDRARDDLEETEQAFIWRVIGDLVDDLAETPAVDMKSLTSATEGSNASAPVPEPEPESSATCPDPVFCIMGVPVNDHGDTLALRMLAQLLPRPGCALNIVPTPESPMAMAERVAEVGPDLVLLSHLPPSGFAATRYLVRRLRARFAEMPIMVGRWRAQDGNEEDVGRLTGAGASVAAFRLIEARDLLLDKYLKKPEPSPVTETETGPDSGPEVTVPQTRAKSAPA